MIVAHQEVWARHNFSLAWLEAEGNLSEGVLARLIGITLLLNLIVLLAVYWNWVETLLLGCDVCGEWGIVYVYL
jgi:hypothetical protein